MAVLFPRRGQSENERRRTVADVQRYRDPVTGQLWTLTEADAKARGFVLDASPDEQEQTGEYFPTRAEMERAGYVFTENDAAKPSTSDAPRVQMQVDGAELGRAVSDSTQKQAEQATPDATTDFPRHIGGGVYELSDGDHVRGKDEAEEAQAKLDSAPAE